MPRENCSAIKFDRTWQGKLCASVLALLALAHSANCGYIWNSPGKDWSVRNEVIKTAPEFEDTETQVTVGVGRTAFLPCRVKNLNDKMVSWIRTSDLHILTSGRITFTADSRFESANVKGTFNWGLKLRNSQYSDSGTYECQVNTEPKMNRKVALAVVTEETLGDALLNDINLHMADQAGDELTNGGSLTKILGAEEQFVKTGSTITFTCLVVTPNQTASSVDWLKDGRQVSFQAARGGIIVETERSTKRTTSRLTVSDVRQEDTGNYTCKPSNTKSHSISLIVVEGEQTQAMKRNRSNVSPSSGIPFPLTLCFFFLCTVSFR
ncbi:UNVERIFIED_CONTAM: hypothetical protein PYX00_008662 [Menopon gallinae]|uniref:Ig-like domain-containing protein n=1 Tax=Menopon gallinae TaxID=328185 RepID=A0AAW2HNR8_9NEOP